MHCPVFPLSLSSLVAFSLSLSLSFSHDAATAVTAATAATTITVAASAVASSAVASSATSMYYLCPLRETILLFPLLPRSTCRVREFGALGALDGGK